MAINRTNSGTSSVTSYIELGNSTPDGTTGSSHGALYLFGTSDKYTELVALNSTQNRTIHFPDKNGIVALINTNNHFNTHQTIDAANGTTSSAGETWLTLGNITPEGTAGNSYGALYFYGKSSYYLGIMARNLTNNRTIDFPDKNGTVALTSNTASIETYDVPKNSSIDITLWVGTYMVHARGNAFKGACLIQTKQSSNPEMNWLISANGWSCTLKTVPGTFTLTNTTNYDMTVLVNWFG